MPTRKSYVPIVAICENNGVNAVIFDPLVSPGLSTPISCAGPSALRMLVDTCNSFNFVIIFKSCYFQNVRLDIDNFVRITQLRVDF